MSKMNRTESRRDRLRRLVRKTDAEAMLVTNFTNVTYLTGFTGDDSFLLVTARGELLITDSRYTTQLEEECPGLDLYCRSHKVPMPDATAKVLKKSKIRRLAIEAGSMTVSLWEGIAEKVPNLQMVSTTGLVERLREIKDKEEIAAIRVAVDHAERAFKVVRASLRPDQTEKEVADALEHQIRLFGGRCSSFPAIVAVGSRAALPHATPTTRRLGESDFVLVDWGATGRHYMSDLTRVLVTGRILPKLVRVHRVVLRAQRAAIRAIRPGALMCDVDAVARRAIAKAGYQRYFGHGLGHGIGLQIHEEPYLAATKKRPLKAGMVVTVEPGIYVPGWGGVRLEDDVLVTRGGHEVLSSLSKELSDCVVG